MNNQNAARSLVLGAIGAAFLMVAAVGISTIDPETPTDMEADVLARSDTGFPVVHRADGVAVSADAYPGELPAFEQSYVGGTDPSGVDHEPSSWEPTIGVGPDGSAYYLAASRDADPRTGITMYDQIQISKLRPPEVWRSDDQGASWQDVSPPMLPAESVLPFDGTLLESPPSTGDPFLHVDADTGRIFSYQQQAYVLCDHWAVSADKGTTWVEWETCDDDESWGDHPSIATGPPRVHDMEDYPNAVYFCSTAGCRASFDGGFTWTGNVQTSDECDQSNGHLKVGPDGSLYLPRKNCGGAQLAISRDDGQSWTEVLVDDTVWQQSVEDADVHDHEAHVAIDSDNNVYYTWLGENHLPYLAVSTDGGATWTEPINVSAPGVTHTLFPHIVAGNPGNVAFFYWGTTVESGERDDPDAIWNGYVGFSLDVLDPDPVFATTLAHDAEDPLHRGACLLWRCYIADGPAGLIPEELKQVPYEGYPPNGLGMEGVYDFLDMEINPVTGAVWVALVDLCNDECSDSEDGEARARAAVGIQTGGDSIG